MIEIRGKTHIGQRANNEDRYVADAGWGIALVADGMGGMAAGEVAADIVAASVVDRLDAGETLETAIAAAHQDVLDAVAAGNGAAGMGATLVIACFDGHGYRIAWIGDSRAYLWNGELRQLTRDHSRLEQRLSSGELAPEDAALAAGRNVITRAMGSGELAPADVPTVTGKLGRGQSLLLCSDGLSDVLSGSEMAAILQAPGDVAHKLDALVDEAVAKGGRDNITAVLANAGARAPEASSAPPAVSVARADGYCAWFPPGQEHAPAETP